MNQTVRSTISLADYINVGGFVLAATQTVVMQVPARPIRLLYVSGGRLHVAADKLINLIRKRGRSKLIRERGRPGIGGDGSNLKVPQYIYGKQGVFWTRNSRHFPQSNLICTSNSRLSYWLQLTKYSALQLPTKPIVSNKSRRIPCQNRSRAEVLQAIS